MDGKLRSIPGVADYESARNEFRWDMVLLELEGLPGRAGINIAHEIVDRHLDGNLADQAAVRYLDQNGHRRDWSYRRLSLLANRFANLLEGLQVNTGQVVASLLGPHPEVFVTALGTFKRKGIFCPLFSAYGPEPLRSRLQISQAAVLVTTRNLYERKIRPLSQHLPSLQYVLLIDSAKPGDHLSGALSFWEALEGQGERWTIPPTDPEDPAILHFTSGTTGEPKGAVHVHEAVVAHRWTGRWALDIHSGDIVWCTADPGWVTGISYGVIAPLSLGATVVLENGPFDADRWLGILESERVNVWYTSPTAIRMMMLSEENLARHDLKSLRFAASVGEPLNPEAIAWGRETLRIAIHDTWWQTETGAIMIANSPAYPIKVGSMGRPIPGIDAEIVVRNEDGRIEFVRSAEAEGEIALRRKWPSMFRGYLGQPEKYRECFSGDWYLSGDLARRDEEGYFWFVGRRDDVIKSSGHLIGPVEVEAVLLSHPAVAEAAVVGRPDPVYGETVKAFVTVRSGYTAGPELRRGILGHCRKLLGAVSPREVEFTARLPKTHSGKIIRHLLKMNRTDGEGGANDPGQGSADSGSKG